MEEIKRVLFTKRQILILVIMVLYNLFDMAPGLSNYRQYQAEYQTWVDQYEGMENEDIWADLQIITSNGSMLISPGISSYYRDMEYLLGFDDRLENIQKQAQTMGSVSIFAGSEFAKTNIRKTAEDYKRLEGIEVTIGTDEPVEQMLYKHLSSTFLIVYMLLVVYSFLKERKRGLWNMVCASPNGRFRLLTWRFIAVAIAAIGSTLLFTLSELGLIYYYCGGFDEMDRMVQSIEICQTLTIPMTIGEFWVFFTLLRIAGIFFLGIIAWFLLEIIADHRLVGMVWALFAGIELVFQKILTPNDVLYQVNLFTYMDMRTLITTYANLNIFSYAVNQQIVVLISVLIGTVVVFGINTVIYQKRKPISGYAWVDKLLDKTRRLTAPMSYHVSLLRHEQYKMLMSGKGLIIIGCAWFVVHSITGSVGFVSHDEYQTALESYYRQASGPISEETFDYIENKRANLQKQTDERQKLQDQLAAGEIDFTIYQSYARQYENLETQKQAFADFEAHVAELQKMENGYVLPQWVYENLFAYNEPFSTSHRKNGEETESVKIVAMIAIILILFIQLGVETKTGMDRTQNTTVRGRKYLVVRKHIAAWSLSVVLSVGTWIIYTLAVMDAYYGKLPYCLASVNCLPFLSDMPQWIPILPYWIAIVAGRTLVLCALSSVAFFVTEFMKKKA